MKLLLVRHGNTVTSDQTPVRVGANEDLSLTDEGENQARTMATALKTAGIKPDLFIAGPLQRTRRHATLIREGLELPNAAEIEIDRRLTEIDYGSWGGLSDAEIVARFGPEAERELQAWEKESRWPTATATWSPGGKAVTANVADLTAELADRLPPDGIAMVCSSNGILRYFLEMTAEGLAAHQAAGRAKMSTGAASLLRIDQGRADVLFWNLKAGQPVPTAGD